MISRSVIFAVLTVAASLAADAGVTVNWLNPTHSFGAFQEETGPVTCTFLGVNTGTDSLVVLDARANCGCTRPAYSRKPVAPGDTVKISVTFHPEGRPGRFDKQVRVTTNAEGSPSVLHVKGTVIGKPATLKARFPIAAGTARMSKDVCPLGQTYKGHVLASSIQIYNGGSDTIRPYLKYLPKVFNAVFTPREILPGEQGVLSLTAYTSRLAEWGFVSDTLVIVPDGGAAEEHPVTVETTMIVNEDFSGLTPEQRADAPSARVAPGTLDFADINAADGKCTLELTISNVGRSDMLIRRIYSLNDAITIESVPNRIGAGKNKTVKVILDPSLLPADAGILNERITLITNSPLNPNLVIRVVGRIIR